MSTTTITTTTKRRLLFFCIVVFSALFVFSNEHKLNEHETHLTVVTSTLHTSVADPEWFQLISESFKGSTRQPNIGLVNMGGEVFQGLESIDASVTHVEFDRVSPNVTWRNIYPLWIDEDEVQMKPTCPDIPMPNVEKHRGLDIVVAKLPCGNWTEGQKVGIRDVYRLQISLAVAKLAIESGRKEVYVVFVSDGGCEPMLEMFRCDDLVWHQGKFWVYKPDILRLKQKVELPVGACQVAAQPHNADSTGKALQDSSTREAYVTVLHSSLLYVCGAIALAQSILRTNTTKELILLADHTITPRSIQGLEAAGWTVKQIERIRCPSAKKGHFNEWNCSKLRIWQLTGYTKLIYIDADFIVLKNMDHFFAYPQLSASEDTKSIFNSGVMVVEPSQCFFDMLIKKSYTLNSYNGGDQGLLNEGFTWWHRLTKSINFLKCFSGKEGPHELHSDVYTIHFVGEKPWSCYRDYDCNWDRGGRDIFASDQMHRIWWEIYDVLPHSLRPYCGLTRYMDNNLREHREKAKHNTRSNDSHWMIEVKDPRIFDLRDYL